MKMRNSRSTKRSLASIVLGFESFVIFFATLAAFGLKLADPEWVFGVGLSFALLSIVTPAFLSKPIGYWIGWAIQAAVFVSGFWLWGMFIIGAILIGMWIWALVAGSTIDRARANYQKLMSEENND
jgi:hypothetical protein